MGFLNDAVGRFRRVYKPMKSEPGVGASPPPLECADTEISDRLMAVWLAAVMSLVVRIFKREVRAFGGCLGMHRR